MRFDYSIEISIGFFFCFYNYRDGEGLSVVSLDDVDVVF